MEMLPQTVVTPHMDHLEKIRLVVSDLDGTLLNEKSQLPAEFPQLVRKLAERDVLFATASGRNWESQRSFFSECANQMAFICDNGAFIMHRGRPFFISELKTELWKAVAQKSAEYGSDCGAVICGVKGTYMIRNPKLHDAVSHFYSTIQYVDGFDEISDQIFKVSICCLRGTEGALFDTFYACFSEYASLVCAHPLFMDVMNAGINKASGIHLLQKSLGLESEQVMAFGDYSNDIEMLRHAGISYIMENAPDFMQKYAMFQAPSNEKNGVVTVLENTLLK